jgi:glutaconyl-CoA/methylmalonyl-CoA decarboxylase subunit gamma
VKSYQVTVNGHPYTVEIDDPFASPVCVRVDGEEYVVTLDEAGLPAPASAAAATVAIATASVATPADVGSPPVLAAPLPGTVLEIGVHAGQAVVRGQILCYLEAMKMKNAIKSPRDGVIADVAVAEGQTVAHGDRLFTFR